MNEHKNPPALGPNPRPMRGSRWVHGLGIAFSSIVAILLIIFATTLPEPGDDREAAAWALSGVGSFVLGSWILLSRWLKRRAARRALESSFTP